MLRPAYSEAVVPWNGCGQGGVLRKSAIRRAREFGLTVDIGSVSSILRESETAQDGL